MAIQEEIEKHGRMLTLGVFYTVLKHLERQQLVRHRDGDPPVE